MEEIGPNRVIKRKKFNVKVFCACDFIVAKFPIRARAFKKVDSAITHEATSEGTFNDAGRAYSKLRVSMNPQRLCDGILNASGEKRGRISSEKVHSAYKEMKKQRVAAAHQEERSNCLAGGVRC